ncbi:MAG: TIGR01212 family radical SAM protein [Muribaculaceae bacterium]|nr:TIGR01212 family radical SAM protein [Muribaculaceae bacterium]
MAQGYRDFAQFLSEHFDCKMQKIAVNAGFTCPNRDGSKGHGGCTYCNNQTFNPAYCTPSQSITDQLEEGKRFFGKKYPDMRYLAYFQAYTNTHGDIDHIMEMYREALSVDKVDGIIIGTRPDCMPDELLTQLAELHKSHWIMIEYGAETAHNNTLDFINRCHSWEDTTDAVMRTHNAGIPCGLHLILGLPGEDESMILDTIKQVSRLPLDTIKLHQLQLVRGTRMAKDIEDGLYNVTHFSVEEYISLCCKVIQLTSPSIAIERFVSQSPDNLLISPRWGLKNYEFTNLLNNAIKKLGVKQGELLNS